MGAILLAVEAAIQLALSAGQAIVPLIPGITALFNSFATATGATQADFDAFHAIVKPYEDDLAAQAAEAAQEPPTSA
jgi:hypothetical protein